mgnify:CR=1 FL=1
MHNFESTIFNRILEEVASIPYGKVSTYGEVSRKCGIKDARLVGFALASLNQTDLKVPWHRVINRFGKISRRSPESMHTQKSILIKEGVLFNKKGEVDLKIFGAG